MMHALSILFACLMTTFISAYDAVSHDCPGRNPNWFSHRLFVVFIWKNSLCVRSLSNTLLNSVRRQIGRYALASLLSLLGLLIRTSRAVFHSWGKDSSSKHLLYNLQSKSGELRFIASSNSIERPSRPGTRFVARLRITDLISFLLKLVSFVLLR